MEGERRTETVRLVDAHLGFVGAVRVGFRQQQVAVLEPPVWVVDESRLAVEANFVKGGAICNRDSPDVDRRLARDDHAGHRGAHSLLEIAAELERVDLGLGC